MEVDMLELRQRLFYESYLNFDTINLIPEFWNNCGKAFILLVSPTDTTENTVDGQLKSGTPVVNDIYGGVKVLFWIVMSITIALLIGQLS